jgi:hypothetical protein
MWKKIGTAWSLYRHFAAFKGLLEALGIWKYLYGVGAIVVSGMLALQSGLPLGLQVAVGLVIFILIVFSTGFVIALIRVHRSGVTGVALPSDSRIIVGKAIFRCDQHPEYYKVVTSEVQRLIDGKQVIYAHQNGGFGDPCLDHWTRWPEGHDKSLFFDYTFSASHFMPYNERRTLKVSEIWKEA